MQQSTRCANRQINQKFQRSTHKVFAVFRMQNYFQKLKLTSQNAFDLYSIYGERGKFTFPITTPRRRPQITLFSNN